MKSLVSFFVLLLAVAVHALSSTGNRVLVIFEDTIEKGSYEQFLGDLNCRRRPMQWVV
jgi:oligosaccharyltransferase complex subunit beta